METNNNNITLAIQQLYENESLTNACMDESAELLLAWGEAQLQGLDQPDEEALDKVLRQLQRTMRTINRLVADQQDMSEAKFAKRLLRLVDQAMQLAEEKTAPPSNDL